MTAKPLSPPMEALSREQPKAGMTDMTFADALDALIATSITCLRNSNPRLKRAVEICINYRELSPAGGPAISLQQLEMLGAWLCPEPTGRDDQ